MILMDMNIQEAEPVSREQKLAKKNENKPHQDVLYDVFPRHIADALKAGRKVEAETHDLVTIFFSDIVGFTDISQALPPMKVSLMLERLYTCFDKLARAHKVSSYFAERHALHGIPRDPFSPLCLFLFPVGL